MHPSSRPIHRSRLAWFALPGLLFLMWGWFNKPASYCGITLTLGDHVLQIGDYGRTTCVSLVVYPRGHWTAPGFSYEYGSRPEVVRPDQSRLFPRPWRYEKWSDPGLTVFTLEVSYWLLLLLYTGVFVGIRAGWQRRHARLVTPAALTLS